MSKSGKVTLNEILGQRGEEFTSKGLELDDLPHLLGEKMPRLEYHVLGRIRLIRALRNRFGGNYRSVPGIQQVLQKFDHQSMIEKEHHLIKKRLGKK